MKEKYSLNVFKDNFQRLIVFHLSNVKIVAEIANDVKWFIFTLEVYFTHTVYHLDFFYLKADICGKVKSLSFRDLKKKCFCFG